MHIELLRPARKEQAERAGSQLFKPLRQVIERAFNDFKHSRGLASRYDKHAVAYRSALVLAAALHWLATSYKTRHRCRSGGPARMALHLAERR
jgi:hypothetical protein